MRLVSGATVGIVVDIDRDNLSRDPYLPSYVGGTFGDFCRALLKLMIHNGDVDFVADQRTPGPESPRTGSGGQGERTRTSGKPSDGTIA